MKAKCPHCQWSGAVMDCKRDAATSGPLCPKCGNFVTHVLDDVAERLKEAPESWLAAKESEWPEGDVACERCGGSGHVKPQASPPVQVDLLETQVGETITVNGLKEWLSRDEAEFKERQADEHPNS